MLQLQDVTKAFGEKTLLEHVTWQVGDRDAGEVLVANHQHLT